MLPLTLVTIAEQVGAHAAAADAKRRAEQRLPPAPPPPPPTFGDRLAEIALWIWILLPGLVIGGVFGGLLYAVFKVAFAAQGVEFP